MEVGVVMKALIWINFAQTPGSVAVWTGEVNYLAIGP